jgi:hypothetical protein
MQVIIPSIFNIFLLRESAHSFLIVCTARSAAQVDHGEAVEQGKNWTPSGSMNLWKSVAFAIADSLSQQKNFGMPKGKMIVDFTASIKSSVFLDLRGLSWTYPVNMSTARKISEWPFGIVVIEGIMSTAQVTHGA